MAKWADYLISAVRYEENDDTRHISALKIREHVGDKISAPSIWTRKKVVNSIKAANSFITIIKNPKTGNWGKGEEVSIFTLDTIDYLRTDANRTGSDNLESLPEF